MELGFKLGVGFCGVGDFGRFFLVLIIEGRFFFCRCIWSDRGFIFEVCFLKRIVF